MNKRGADPAHQIRQLEYMLNQKKHRNGKPRSQSTADNKKLNYNNMKAKDIVNEINRIQ